MAKVAASKCGKKENREVEKGKESVGVERKSERRMDRDEARGPDWIPDTLLGFGFIFIFLFFLLFSFVSL
jgi:hypothetical protein